MEKLSDEVGPTMRPHILLVEPYHLSMLMNRGRMTLWCIASSGILSVRRNNGESAIALLVARYQLLVVSV